MKKYCRAILATSVFLMTQSSAWAHATLQSSNPANGAQVAPAPKVITMQFNEKLEGAFSKATLTKAGGKAVKTEKASIAKDDPSVLHLAVPDLAAGKYTVRYTAVGHDGHPRRGEFSFDVK